jgi:ribonucleoside-diphosphate reductase subunit M1
MYSRRVLAGEFTVLNKYLLSDLMRLNLWSPALKNKIVAERGSIANIPEIPDDIKSIYKTVWEIKMRDLVDMAADRGAFIDQSQSFNCFIAQPTSAKLTSMHFYAWKKGLKTGMYYLRTLPAVDAIQFTVDQRALKAMRSPNPPSSSTSAAIPLQSSIPTPEIHSSAPGLTVLSPSRVTTTPQTPTQTDQFVPVEGEICKMEEGCLVCGS